MNKLNIVNFEGLNYYNVKGSKMVNVTEDIVTEENYPDAHDINTFTMKDAVPHSEALEVEVMSHVAYEKLHCEILTDVKKVTSNSDAHTIVARIDNQRAIRENYILAEYDSIKVEGNLLHIYSNNKNGITVDFRLDEPTKLGNIVG